MKMVLNRDCQEKLLLSLIVTTGLLLRLSRIEDGVFAGEAAKQSAAAYLISKGAYRPTLGFWAGICYLPGPAYYYLTSLASLFSPDPSAIAGLISFVDGLAILLCFYVGRELANWKAGIIASSLYAVSPSTVLIGATIWNPNVVPFFSILLFYCFLKLLKKQYQYFPILVISLAIGVQSHLTILTLVPIVVMLLILFKVKIKRSSLIMGVMAFGILFAPFLYYEFTHDFWNIQRALKFITSTSSVPSINASVSNVLVNAAFGLDYIKSPLLFFANTVELFLFLISLFYLSFYAFFRKSLGFLALLMWMAVPFVFLQCLSPLLTSLYGIGERYFNVVLPTIPLSISLLTWGIAVPSHFKHGSIVVARKKLILVISVLLLIVFFQISNTGAYQPLSSSYSLRTMKRITSVIMEQSRGENFDVVVGSIGLDNAGMIDSIKYLLMVTDRKNAPVTASSNLFIVVDGDAIGSSHVQALIDHSQEVGREGSVKIFFCRIHTPFIMEESQSGQFYYVYGFMKHRIVNWSVLVQRGYAANQKIQEDVGSEYAEGEPITARLPQGPYLVGNVRNGEVWYVFDDKKYFITSPEAFIKYGFRWNSIEWLEELDFPSGLYVLQGFNPLPDQLDSEKKIDLWVLSPT